MESKNKNTNNDNKNSSNDNKNNNKINTVNKNKNSINTNNKKEEEEEDYDFKLNLPKKNTIYVPSSYISTLKSLTNWSVITGYSNNSVVAIEGSYYATHYADGTTIST